MAQGRDAASLLDIARAARRVLKFKQGLDRTTFLQDEKTQSAVVYQLLIVGEAVKRLSKELRNQNPEIPWSLIAGMRDTLAHRYDDVDLEEVWKTAERDIPVLLTLLEPLLPTRDSNE